MAGTKRNWSENYQLVYSYYCSKNQGKEIKLSQRSFCQFLGISLGKREKWQKGQWPSAEDLAKLHNKMGFSYRWLITGEGDPFEDFSYRDIDLKRDQTKISSIPLYGFASCDISGWQGSIVFTVPVSLPQLTSDTIAVLVEGDSMVPAGIGSGQICFCDPNVEAIHGDAVYVKQKDGRCTIKQYMDQKYVPAGSVREGHMHLQGWRTSENGEPQKPFWLSIAYKHIEVIAPVILIRRRI